MADQHWWTQAQKRAVEQFSNLPGTHYVGTVEVSSPAPGLVFFVLGSSDLIMTSAEAEQLADKIRETARFAAPLEPAQEGGPR